MYHPIHRFDNVHCRIDYVHNDPICHQPFGCIAGQRCQQYSSDWL